MISFYAAAIPATDLKNSQGLIWGCKDRWEGREVPKKKEVNFGRHLCNELTFNKNFANLKPSV